jgi:(1->4)-alpha-D-glucan 1-alpha-D-glucosylmutase
LFDTSQPNGFWTEFLSFQEQMARYGVLNSLSQVLIKITSPGVPDFYQGSELWDLNMVDPDNRRAVDFVQRSKLLDEVGSENGGVNGNQLAEWLGHPQDGRLKLFLTHRLLQARQCLRRVFENGDYMPLQSQGHHSNHVIGFARRSAGKTVIAVATRFFTSLIRPDQLPLGKDVWHDTAILLPAGFAQSWQDLIAAGVIQGKKRLYLRDILQRLPVCLLVSID